jgi:hypothetical protein
MNPMDMILGLIASGALVSFIGGLALAAHFFIGMR